MNRENPMNAQQSEGGANAWTTWCAFTDACAVAPDTCHAPEMLAARYANETGRRITPDEVRTLTPERAGERPSQ